MAKRGRPTVEEKRNVTFNVRFTDSEYKELRTIAHEAGCTLSGLIREAVNNYILGDDSDGE